MVNSIRNKKPQKESLRSESLPIAIHEGGKEVGRMQNNNAYDHDDEVEIIREQHFSL